VQVLVVFQIEVS